MNTKTLAFSIFAAAILIATFFVAKPWAQPVGDRGIASQTPLPSDFFENPDALTKTPEPPLVITKDKNILVGQGFFYDEQGVLYKERLLPDGTLTSSRDQVATGSIRLVDQSEDYVLFIKDIIVPFGDESDGMNELWLLDRRTGDAQKIFDNVIQEGDISSGGDRIVVKTQGHNIFVLTPQGNIMTKIGVHGTSPKFSPDGGKIAYIKLPDEPIEMGHEFQGIAVYDLKTQEDKLILKSAPGSNEWMITGWSPDGTRIYFPSGSATRSVALNGTGKRQETNNVSSGPTIPPYLGDLLFSEDGKIVFGEADGIWAFKVGKDNKFLEGKKVIEGTQGYSSRLYWLEKGKRVISHLYGNSTKVYDISSLD